MMRAAVAIDQDPDRPLSKLLFAEDYPEPRLRDGWARVRVRAATLNPHDVWTLRGVGHPAERIPIVLGCDGAGVTDDGREVILYPVIADALAGRGDETFDPDRSLLSERVNGTLADYVLVPEANLIPKPERFSFAEAAAVGVVWATAYRMLFTRGGVRPGSRVLVQGSSGGVAGAAIRLGVAAGARVWATGRSAEKRAHARKLGAQETFDPGARLPERVDVVIDTIGEATWSHSLRVLRPGGTLVIAGATTGGMPPAELHRIFHKQLTVTGSVMSTRAEFIDLLRMMETAGIRPSVDSIIPFERIREGYERLERGAVLGKIVVDMSGAERRS